ncbi:oxysterol-binding protein-related protein 8-like isoform X1 [Tigriopus californicus]|uniref:oxysterol-binding protein-related protein 8-like isoform X1 n=1 Tax=Tigriopus californicus TaxID=6832 RepID=UPI0027DA1C66|nr:oxysterol-binding protein-related protein 8-like isoform X1 [Tigriopus californicus]
MALEEQQPQSKSMTPPKGQGDYAHSALAEKRRAPLNKLMKMRLSVSSDSEPPHEYPATAPVGTPTKAIPIRPNRSYSANTSFASSNSPQQSALGNGASSATSTPVGSSSAAGRSSVDRKESYKAQKKNYVKAKKRVAQEVLSSFQDHSTIVVADWLKVRGTLKGWTKLWCVLKPGLLFIYRSQKTKSSQWVGTIMLSHCELIERPSLKDGFCFKLFNLMDQTIWANRGPEGENYGAVTLPLPTSHLIFRATNSAAGKCWMDALELALRCSSLLQRSMSSKTNSSGVPGGNPLSPVTEHEIMSTSSDVPVLDPDQSSVETHVMNDSDVEKHFEAELQEEGNNSSCDDGQGMMGSDGSDFSDDTPFLEPTIEEEMPLVLTHYSPDPSDEVFGTAKDQTEEFSDENKSIVWFLMKQVRPGMDLSRVVLPTFILEPRSFLDKLTDYHYHEDYLSEAVKLESPYDRMKAVVRWYLSGFYKKPKGLKKPYNPILGETFRCYWEHPNGSKTFYIAEQVSHHPPISAFYVTNRQDGYTVASSILAKSKFYGNSTSAILDGTARLNLLPRGEEYALTLPYAHCKGILMGTLTMELGGKVIIECAKTGYSTELEFKLKPFLGGGEFTNAVSGKIRLGKETLSTLNGHWDDCVMLKDKKTDESEIFWKVTPEIRQSRLKRFTVPIEEQGEFESVKLWQKVTQAIEADNQNAATDEKAVLEEAQRTGARERKAAGVEWVPKYFALDPMTEQYEYKHADLRPWDPLNDLFQYEKDFVVNTKTKHKAPMIRTQSIISVHDATKMGKDGGWSSYRIGFVPGSERSSLVMRRRRNATDKLKTTPAVPSMEGGGRDSGSSVILEESEDGVDGKQSSSSPIVSENCETLLRQLLEQHKRNSEKLSRLEHKLEVMSMQQKERDSNSNINRDTVCLVILVFMIQAILTWVVTTKSQNPVNYSGSS